MLLTGSFDGAIRCFGDRPGEGRARAATALQVNFNQKSTSIKSQPQSKVDLNQKSTSIKSQLRLGFLALPWVNLGSAKNLFSDFVVLDLLFWGSPGEGRARAATSLQVITSELGVTTRARTSPDLVGNKSGLGIVSFKAGLPVQIKRPSTSK